MVTQVSSNHRAWAVTCVLAALSACSFLDRQVLALLLPDLHRDLHISDMQFGVLAGPAFILVYNCTLLPAAFLIDRWNRKRIICIGVFIWTTMTIGSAFASTFQEMIILRAGLAFGEALLGPAAISLIGDLFLRLDRPLPTAVYIMGSVVGNTGSAMLSAGTLQLAVFLSRIAPHWVVFSPWRMTLIGVGLPGFLLGILLLIVGREPPRRLVRDEKYAASLLEHIRRRGALYSGAFIGLGLLGTVSAIIAIWGPSYLMRNFNLSQVVAGYTLGGVSLVAGIAGTVALPTIFRDRFRERKTNQVIWIAAAGVLAIACTAFVGGFTDNLAICLISFSVALFLLMGIGTLPTLFIQLYTPSNLRGRVSAALFFVVYMFSAGLAPVLVPLFANKLYHGQGALGQSIGTIAVVVGLGAAVSFLAITRVLRAAEEEATGTGRLSNAVAD